MSDKHTLPFDAYNGHCLFVDGLVNSDFVVGHPVPQARILKILGSMVACDLSEVEAYHHRIVCGWATFHKWAKQVMSKATIASRLKFFSKNVYKSLTWALVTCRCEQFLLDKLDTIQAQMVRKMLGIKRKPVPNSSHGLEPWLAWQVRSFSKAKEVIGAHNCSVSTLFERDRQNWMQHVARFGVEDKPPQLLKSLLLWRNLEWWRRQQFYNDLFVAGPQCLRHPWPFVNDRRWEETFPLDWILQFSVVKDTD